MQQQTQVVCPKPTDAQIQSQIENLRWNEKQQEIQNAFNRQYQQEQLGLQQRQIQAAHQHYMVEHLSAPLEIVGVVSIIAFALCKCWAHGTQAGILKNRDDNAADVVRANEIIDKHEANPR